MAFFIFQTALLPALVDRHNVISKSTTNILRKFMSRAVVLKFTVQKKIIDKIVLKETAFCRCALGKMIWMEKIINKINVERKSICQFSTKLLCGFHFQRCYWKCTEMEMEIQSLKKMFSVLSEVHWTMRKIGMVTALSARRRRKRSG